MTYQNQYQVLQHLTDAAEINRLGVISMIAAMGNEIEVRAEKIRKLEAQLAEAKHEGAMFGIVARAKQGEAEYHEQGHRLATSLLGEANALLTDWVHYNDNKKNADLVGFSRNLLKRLP